jgi:hypothetical protein
VHVIRALSLRPTKKLKKKKITRFSGHALFNQSYLYVFGQHPADKPNTNIPRDTRNNNLGPKFGQSSFNTAPIVNLQVGERFWSHLVESKEAWEYFEKISNKGGRPSQFPRADNRFCHQTL